ncbi:Tryprostatin B 6-hydroxylase [Rhypophila decipiens]|uniref:Tryprostatin B 6-hydroxylase n=1 Tax=Rhypophila decipiens TaxID=261697 RepID=A0AAN7B9P1_9PEZI|nr:Tryprostatin B 6-hydroxylase [Rhypophila decipiens]
MSPINLCLSNLAHDLSQQCLAGAVLGFLSHTLYFIRGYHDQHALSIFLTHLLGSLVLLILTSSFLAATLITTSYLTALFTSIALYRLFFHPLRNFPGPLLAKLTRLYIPFAQQADMKMHIHQNNLFKKYNSDIIRVAPNELYILQPSAIQLIHGAKSGCRKRNAGVYNVVTYKGEHNLDSMLDREDHRWRRQVWERSLTTKNLTIYEVKTKETISTWLSKLAESAKSQKPIDTSLFSLLLTFENMGQVGFSHSFGSLSSGKEAPMLHYLETLFGDIAKLGEMVWPMALVQSLASRGIIDGGDAAKFDTLTVEMANRRMQDIEKGDEGTDMFGFFVADHKSEKPLAYDKLDTVYADAGLILVGATDTIAVVLSYCWFYLVSSVDEQGRSYQDRLFEEVRSVFGQTKPGEFVDSDLQKCELLEAVLSETLRLENPVANNASRMTPKEGLMLADGTHIPGGVSVRVPGYGLQRSEKTFVKPDDFIPERWTTKPELVLDRLAFMPFIVGPNNCVGKRLAWMVLRLVVSYTVYHYKFQLAPGEDGKAIHEQAQNHLILSAGPLQLVFEKREN